MSINNLIAENEKIAINNLSSISLGSLTTNGGIIKLATTAPIESNNDVFNSILFFKKCWNAEDEDAIPPATNEVPTATCATTELWKPIVGKSSSNNGTNTIPPPIPSSPIRNPVIKPISINIIIINGSINYSLILNYIYYYFLILKEPY